MDNYSRIAQAIKYITDNIESQPTLEDLSKEINLSPFHLQRLFKDWAGISPKRFLQIMTVNQAKKLLDESYTILDTSEKLGLSSSARLHDHFVSLEAVTPGEYKSDGDGLTIKYGTHPTPFGHAFIAITERGICKLNYYDEDDTQNFISELTETWPAATIFESDKSTEPFIKQIFYSSNKKSKPVSLYVKGTNFQVNVWRALLNIQPGHVSTYGHLAKYLGDKNASRAVGRAVGANPVAYLIPCHRVILASGVVGNYRWGTIRKKALLCWENAMTQKIKAQ